MNAHPLMRALWQPRLLAALEWIGKSGSRRNRRRAHGRRGRGAGRDDGARASTIIGRADRIDRLRRRQPRDRRLQDRRAAQRARWSRRASRSSSGTLGLMARARRRSRASQGEPTRFEYWSLGSSDKSETGFGYRQDAGARRAQAHWRCRSRTSSPRPTLFLREALDSLDLWATSPSPRGSTPISPSYGDIRPADAARRVDARARTRMSGKVHPLKDNQTRAVDPARQRVAVRLGGHRQDAGAVGAGAAAAAPARGAALEDPLPDLHQGRRGRDGRAGQRGAGELGADGRCGRCARPQGDRRGGRSGDRSRARGPCSPACSTARAAACGSIRSTPSRSGCSRPFPKKRASSPAPRRWRTATATCSRTKCSRRLLLDAEEHGDAATLDRACELSLKMGPDAVEAWLMTLRQGARGVVRAGRRGSRRCDERVQPAAGAGSRRRARPMCWPCAHDDRFDTAVAAPVHGGAGRLGAPRPGSDRRGGDRRLAFAAIRRRGRRRSDVLRQGAVQQARRASPAALRRCSRCDPTTATTSPACVPCIERGARAAGAARAGRTGSPPRSNSGASSRWRGTRPRSARADRFRRPDPPRRRRCCIRSDLGDVDPLQARPAVRPYPRRRGAGHQRRAMADHRGADRRFLRRARPARRQVADDVRGRRLQAGDLPLPGHQPGEFRAAPASGVRRTMAGARRKRRSRAASPVDARELRRSRPRAESFRTSQSRARLRRQCDRRRSATRASG